jgi:hypothetical protein
VREIVHVGDDGIFCQEQVRFSSGSAMPVGMVDEAYEAERRLLQEDFERQQRGAEFAYKARIWASGAVA